MPHQWWNRHSRTFHPFQGLHGYSGETGIPQPDDEIPRGRGRGTGRGQSPPKSSKEVKFPQFSRLPLSVRLRIWEITVEHRIVEVRVNYSKEDAEYDMVIGVPGNRKFPEGADVVIPFFSSTPVPAPLQACREARNHLGTVCYQRAFHDLEVPVAREDGEETETELSGNGEHKHDGEEPKPQNTNQQTPLSPAPDSHPYVWLNFTSDLLSIGPSLFSHFHLYASQITALRFQRELPSDDDVDNEVVNPEANLEDHRLLSTFTNLHSIHIICSYGQDVQDWAGAETELGIKFPCGKQRVLVISPGDDVVVEAGEVDIYD